jgi:cytochrome c-type biogenesis protein
MIAEIFYAYLLGLLSILSPCTFIIVPIMISDLNSRFIKILSFLGGITVTFGILGVLSALTGKLLTNFMGPYLYLLAGAITLIAGLNMLEVIDLHIHSFFRNFKTKNNFLLGLVYGGIALSCVGPLMASVLVFITVKANILYGFLLMFIFSLGFITPFILCAYILTDKKVCSKLGKHSILIRNIGGIMLLLVSAYLLFVALKGII